MFDDIPANYRIQTADNEEEGWRYTQGDKNARRPPELLTRDHVARCIRREVQGRPRQPAWRRVSRHRLDQGEDSQRRRTHQEENCPACTTSSNSSRTSISRKEPMEVGPTTHYMMGGVRVDRRLADVRCSGPVCRRRSAARIAWRESPRRQFAFRSFGLRQDARVEYAANLCERKLAGASINPDEVALAEKHALAPFGRDNGEGPYRDPV